MSKATQQQLQVAYQKLPEDVKTVYASEETSSKIYAIGKKYNLHVDQLGQLVDEVGLVMVGLTPTDRFANEVTTRLQISPDTAAKIAADVNTEIFAKIRASLQSLGSPGVPAARATAFPTTPQQARVEPMPASTTPNPPATTVLEEKLAKPYGAPVVSDKPKTVDPYLESIE